MLVVIVVAAVVGYAVYDFKRGGYFDLPPLAENEYPISFKSGLRGIVAIPQERLPAGEPEPPLARRLDDAIPDRKFLGLPSEVPAWFEDTWSKCRMPTRDEKAYYETTTEGDWRAKMVGARIEAVCEIEADGELIPRGLIYSVPKN